MLEMDLYQAGLGSVYGRPQKSSLLFVLTRVNECYTPFN